MRLWAADGRFVLKKRAAELGVGCRGAGKLENALYKGGPLAAARSAAGRGLPPGCPRRITVGHACLLGL